LYNISTDTFLLDLDNARSPISTAIFSWAHKYAVNTGARTLCLSQSVFW
jgi:hypothetical protein